MSKPENIDKVRHSLAHLLASATLEYFPDALPTLGPAIDNGFYYDFDFPTEKPTDADLAKIEAKMKAILPSWQEFEKLDTNQKEAEEMFKGNPYKLELIKEIAERGETLSLYKSGDFVDLCRGGHTEKPRDVDASSFKLSHVAGAYWRGDEKNKMLTRIYGLAFSSAKELSEYEKMLEEAKKRDHKKLGVELDLFVFSDLVGSGLPLWTPRGTIVRNLLDDFVWSLRKEKGYEQVDIPHLAKKELYLTSGHWDKYQDDLFQIKTREGHIFALKPMNCPHHAQIYSRKLWSYREIPQRYASTTKVYRDEQSGELAGLSRVRAITQDDAHVFCRTSQVKDEVLKIWDIVSKFYGTFNIPVSVRLSLSDPEHQEKYLGDKAVWKEAEKVLREIVKSKEIPTSEGLGEAAFYGPKLDFIGKDAIGREHQVATIQLDMNQPERFDLTCVNEKGERERIVMIHAAIMGSIERFVSVMLEHTAGAFPLWLSPVQVKILPIGEKHFEYAGRVLETLREKGLRAEMDESGESLGKKIREAKVSKVPYIFVVGDKEIDGKVVSVESRDKGSLGQMELEEATEKLLEEIKRKN